MTTGPEQDTSGPDSRTVDGKYVTRLGNVSEPDIAIYLPESDKPTPAVVICPGGGHHILAYDLEGTEVAEWLNSIGIAGIVVKYRVPTRDADMMWKPGVQDTQRAIATARSKAAEWNLDPSKIGVLGFSAGGSIAARTGLFAGEMQYEKIDAIDETSSRPDFSVLVYCAYLTNKEATALSPEVQSIITANAPPTLFIHAGDDRVVAESSILLALELRKLKIPAELHVFEKGGHGYGLRPTDVPVTHWPKLAEKWFVTRGIK